MSKKLSIKEICNKFDLSRVWVRRALLQGKLKGEKIKIAEKTYKWVVDEEEVMKWRQRSSKAGRRKDGRTKYNFYATSEEMKAVKELLDKNSLETPMKRANPPKTS